MVREVGVFQFSSKFLSDVNNSNSNLDSRRLGWYLPSSWISTWTINHSSQMNLDGSVPEISKWYLGTCSHHFLTFLWHVANLTSSDQWPDTELVKTFTLRRCKCWKCFPSCSPPNWVSQWVSGWCFQLLHLPSLQESSPCMLTKEVWPELKWFYTRATICATNSTSGAGPILYFHCFLLVPTMK